MRPARCLGLACRPAACGRTSGSAPAAPRREPPARALSTAPDAGARASRFRGHHVSPFKLHRQQALREDQQSEEPLFLDPYPRLESSAKRMSASEFLEAFHDRIPGEEVVLAGRIRHKRAVGRGLLFVDIVNEFQQVQVMINKNKVVGGYHGRVQRFLLFKKLVQVGDYISVGGVATRTSSGQLTLEARDFPELLAPAMEQIPEKLTDAKMRMQERHVDMLVNREAVDILRLRAEITRHMRDHFHSRRFLEFQTPILAHNAGGAVARPFVTKASELRNRDLALRVAPELWLKRLVVGGVDRVFEIGPAFRNEGVDATHNPEFTMCEFYSAYSNLRDLIGETEELLCSMAKHAQALVATQLTSLPPVDLARFVPPFRQVEFVPALEQALGIRLPKLTAEGALPELLAVLKLAAIGVPGEAPSSLPKLLDRLAAVYLEPLAFAEPVFVTNHPACMSPLAKSFLCPKTLQLVSARAELFVGGRELANMYEEENDPEAQLRKLAAHRSLVNKPNGDIGFQDGPAQQEPAAADDDWSTSPLDRTYVKALDYALPPTGGWGCGVERLVMLFSGANRISDCLSFGTLRNVVGLSADKQDKGEDEGL